MEKRETMISKDDIRKQAERRFPDFLRSVVTGESFFPLEIRFGKRVPRGEYHAFAERRNVLLSNASDVISEDGDGAPRSSDGYIVELARHNSRRYGRQMLPTRIYFEDEVGYAAFLGRNREVRRFREAVSQTRQRLPKLVPWLARYAPHVTPHLDHWDELLTIARYFVEHPRPNLYVRELPLPVHTKFVENHAGILRKMLDFLLAEEAIDDSSSEFAKRFGLKYDEPLVRMRLLDSTVARSWPADDISIPVSAAAGLGLEGSGVVITENKMTFLTLPSLKGGLAICGDGFKIELLRTVEWLRQCRVIYWGDLDAHGFVILSRLRSFVPAAESVMMDVETFESFAEFAVSGTPADEDAAPNLTSAERAVFRSLVRTNRRLEQERIPQTYVADRLARLSNGSSQDTLH